MSKVKPKDIQDIDLRRLLDDPEYLAEVERLLSKIYPQVDFSVDVFLSEEYREEALATIDKYIDKKE